jgi:hypothetical protein
LVHRKSGWTWIDGDAILAAAPECRLQQSVTCATCTLSNMKLGKCGLLWIGESFYKTPGEWTDEAVKLGISRRISAVPNDFVLGETFVMVAHSKAIPLPDNLCGISLNSFGVTCMRQKEHDGECDALWDRAPGVFQIFKPTAIEYVVKDGDSDEKLEKLVKRGITPVRIERKDCANGNGDGTVTQK